MIRRFWTTGEIRRLLELYPDMDNGEIGASLNRTWSAVQNMAVKLGLHKSQAFMLSPVCRFQRGMEPWNKGMHWNPPGSQATQFKKGERGPRQRRVRSTRWTRDGVEVKVAEPNVWRSKARVVWEKHYGSIPARAIVRLKDGDRKNCKPENLMLITRAEHARLNYRPRKPKPAPAWLSSIAA